MLPLTTIAHEHHDRLWGYVRQLDELADCLNADCLDSVGLASHLPQLREVHTGLVEHLIPHMEAVEVAVHPTPDRLLADRDTSAPMAAEHREIRRLVDAMDAFIDDPEAHGDRAAVLTLRRTLLRLYALLKTHLYEEELYIPILEDRLTPAAEQALARSLDHLAEERL